MIKIGLWLGGLALFWLVLQLLGVDVSGWLRPPLGPDQGHSRPATSSAALASRPAQTFFAGLLVLRHPQGGVPGEVAFWPIVAAYAVGVAMNGFLPANIGTFVTLLMFVAVIPGCTFAGSIAAYLVQKIFFTIAGTFVYLYMFLSVPGAFDLSFGNVTSHPGAHDRRSSPARVVLLVDPRPDLLAPGEEAVGAGETGRRDPLAAEALPDARLPAFLPLLACKLDRDRDLPRRVRAAR